MNKIVDQTNNKINAAIARLQIVESYNKSMDKYTSMKVTGKIELDAPFVLTYF